MRVRIQVWREIFWADVYICVYAGLTGESIYSIILVFRQMETPVNKIKPYVRPALVPNPEPALAAFGNHQFNLVIAAAARAREIQHQRLREVEADPHRRYQHGVTVASMEEFGSGQKDPEEYRILAGGPKPDSGRRNPRRR